MKPVEILVVEDDRLVAEGIKINLERLGYRVGAIVPSGEAAIARIEACPPGLVLMDIMLAGAMNGIETAAVIRDRFDIPLVYLTAHTDQTLLEGAKKTDPAGYVVKPFREYELKVALEIGLYKHEMEQRLRKHEELLGVTLNSIGDAVITTDTDGLVTYMNPVARTLTGWTLKEASGRAVEEIFVIVNETTRRKEASPVAGALREGVAVGLANHTMLIARDGREIPIEDSCAPISDPETGLFGAVLVFKDVSEKKRIERQLSEENALRTRLIEALPYPTMLIRKDRTILFANRVARDVGARVGGLCWRDFGQSDYIPDEDKRRLNQHRDTGALATHCTFCLADTALDDATPAVAPEVRAFGRIWETYWIPAGEDTYLHFAMDITQRKEEEEKQRAILSAMPDAAYIVSPDFRIEFMNPKMIGWVGRDATGEPCHSVLRGPDEKCPDCAFGRIRQGETVETEWTDPDAKGTYSIIEAPVINRDGTISKLTVFRDVTELAGHRRALEERVVERTRELSAANAELARADRLKDEFLANMSHELRTPLTSILGMSEALLEQSYGPLNDRQVKSLQTVEGSGRHLSNLINDILDLSRISAGKMELRTGRVSVEAICRVSLRMVTEMALKKGQRITCENAGGGGFFTADMLRLKQILVNLLTNAVKFTPEGGEIGLVVNRAAGGRTIEFTVRDTGPGIPARKLKTVFDPFVQLDGDASRRYEGAGLGLALVHRLAGLHGGSVRIDSEVNRFTRVTVTLPVGAGDIEDAAGGKKSAPDRRGLGGAQPGVRVLVVDDNKAGNETISQYLISKSISVLRAYDGRQAVDLAREKKPDLILMDIQMPGMDGLEAIARIREAEMRSKTEIRKTPIIALTALAMPGDREKCLAGGADAYISKPVKLKNLMEMIENKLAS